MAVPLLVIKLNDTGNPLGAERVTLNTAFVTPPGSGSKTVASLMRTDGVGSSSVIRITPTLSMIAAFVAENRSTSNVSFTSSSKSPRIFTTSGWLVDPGGNAITPDVAI